MIKLLDINISTIKVNENTIYWDIEPTLEPINNYEIDIFRSEFIGDFTLDGFNLIASGINPEQRYYNDVSISGWDNINRLWYYKLKLKNKTTNQFILYPDFGSYYYNYNIKDNAAKEILRRKKLLLKEKYIGQKFILLKRKTWGQRCSKCWDQELFRTTSEFCTECYGTGWSEGFFKPIPFIGMTNTSPKYSQITMFGTWKPSDVMLYLLNYPLLSERDVIVDRFGKRWSVIQVRLLTKLGYILEQQAQLGLISSDSIIYNIKVDSI